jgi:ribonuclease Z
MQDAGTNMRLSQIGLTSDQVEKLAKGVDIILRSTMHPIMGPDKGSGISG